MIFTDALDKEDDYLTAIKNAVELGYDGIRIHGLRMDVITYGVLEYGISLNNNLDSATWQVESERKSEIFCR